MNIVHLSNSTTTGAYSAAVKIHNILLRRGYNSSLYANYSRVTHKTDSKIYIQNKFKGLYLNIRDKYISPFFNHKLLYKQNKPKEIYSFYQLDEVFNKGINKRLVNALPNNIDILFVHWVSGFVNTWDVLNIQNKSGCKVIYTMMDMAPITGGCHFSMSCNLYMTNCINCPGLSFDKKYIPFVQLKGKAINILKLNARLLTFSKNDFNIAKKSHIKYIDYIDCILPFDIDLFTSQSILNKIFKKDEFHILSCAYSKKNMRKGPNYFFETLIHLDKITTSTIYVHNIDLEFESEYRFRNIKFLHFDYNNNIEDLISLYKKIDILVFTSIADSGPQMIFESLLSGIPVISFDIGYANQLIVDNWNGFIVDVFDTQKMAYKIEEIIYMYKSNLIDSTAIARQALDYYHLNSFESKLNKILNI
jgi:glycosyltransferase involved in cell wall biosynthesis